MVRPVWSERSDFPLMAYTAWRELERVRVESARFCRGAGEHRAFVELVNRGLPQRLARVGLGIPTLGFGFVRRTHLWHTR